MRAFDDPAEILEQTRLVERFLAYVRVGTQSDETSTTCPTTAGQLEMGWRLVSDLRALGLEDAAQDENGYVLATLPGGAPGVLGFCAHLDTAPAFSGKDVRPRAHENYDGAPIRLENGVVIDPAESPELSQCIGDTIITADGRTLLGADDKAGIAAIVGLLEVLRANPDVRHPTLRVCFNPDEEVGRGARHFPLERFAADVAFTVDGGFAGEMNVETFSADKAIVTFTGVAEHPGTAKGKLVNALTCMGRFLARLPAAEAPECTEKRAGFFHATDAQGDAARCRVNVILRDFEAAALAERGRRVEAMARALMAEEPRLKVEVEIQQQYRNMRAELERRPEIAERLQRAIAAAGIEARVEPIRGGTDGAQLTARGLPVPNVFTGGCNFHGPREWLSTRALALSTCTLLNLVQIYAE
ncbi:MAG: peptidase T [Planctomycetes bacterium]|nr:peptidase T [Planctomycetota bacterium]